MKILEVTMSKNGTPLWREAHLQVKMYKTPQVRVRSHFLKFQMSKAWHAAVARSTFASRNAKKLRGSEQFWKLRCPKMARGCGGKHICKSKCTKHRSDVEKSHTAVARSAFSSQNAQNSACSDHFGPLFQVQMSKK